MRINLSSLVLASAAIAATALATVPAQAATEGATTLHVPFSFTIDGKTLPAGAYTVQRDNNGNFIKLDSQNGAEHYNWIASGNDSTAGQRVTLRFDARGASHELQSVQCGRLVTARLDHKNASREAEEIVSGQ